MPAATKSFTIEDQRGFARISGDYNPMHLDPLYARRTQAAEPAVHGIHGMLWALEVAGVTRDEVGTGVKVRFESFLYLDQPVEMKRARRGASAALELVSRGRLVTSIALDGATAAPRLEHGESVILETTPADLSLEDVAGRSGAFVLAGADVDFAGQFPALSAAIGPRRVRAIAALSTLVGMVVPGLHSIFSRCDLAVVDDDGDSDALTFSVVRTNPVLRTATIAFRGGGIGGRIDAFVRTPPVAQASVAELASRVASQDFAGRHALVIGGSRGLGELTAKLVALRGGEVTVTYLRGRDDAERVVRELTAAGLRAASQHFDTSAPELALLRSAAFTDVFYYATPPIFARRMAGYDAAAADRFMAVYCHDFARLAELVSEAERKAILFWPSSTALDGYVPGLAEYAAAKAAGEKLCELLPHRLAKLRFLVRRLPRLDTDQTASAIPVPSESAEAVMHDVLDAMAALRG